MKAYYFDNAAGDQRLPHDSQRPVAEAELSRLGIFHTQCDTVAQVDAIAKDRQYKHRDEITISPSAMGEIYATKVKAFFNEHLHEDEEIRYIIDGSGYFDVRSPKDEWIRLWMRQGDLICLPAGIYHRFTTDEKDYIKAMRLFKDDPKWTPLNRARDLDENEYRKSYLKMRDDESQLLPGV